jgi:hypothetical protein
MKEDWKSVSVKLRSVLKVGDLKFFECPMSVISKQTWAVLGIVNETTDGDCNILHMPFVGTIFDQPQWYRTAVKLVKSERSNNQRERLKRGK